MIRLTTLLELARNGKQFKTSLVTESSSRVRAHARGAILGARSSTVPSIRQVESFQSQEEAMLSALVEPSHGDSAFPLDRLCEQVFYGDTRRLEGVLRRMQEKGMITMVRGADEELSVRLTLKGAVVALYGNWLLEESNDEVKRIQAIGN
jgi:hypothetical protein